MCAFPGKLQERQHRRVSQASPFSAPAILTHPVRQVARRLHPVRKGTLGVKSLVQGQASQPRLKRPSSGQIQHEA